MIPTWVCWHLQGFIDNNLACYARIIPPDYHYLGYVAIGRVLAVDDFQGHHYGRDLMQKAIWNLPAILPRQPILSPLKLIWYTFIKRSAFVYKVTVTLKMALSMSIWYGKSNMMHNIADYRLYLVHRSQLLWQQTLERRWTSDIGRRDIGAASRKSDY